MKKIILVSVLLIFLIGCAEEKEVIKEEFIGPGGTKTLEEYEEYCQKNPEECKKWCKENPKICPEYREPQKKEKEKKEEFVDLTITWESMNGPPGSGHTANLINNPYNHNQLYALAQNNYLYKSEDKGESWHVMKGSGDFQINSMAVYKDRLFVCGEHLYSYDNEENLEIIKEKWWCNQVMVSDNKVFISSSGRRIKDLRILYSDLGSEDFDWIDITPSKSELKDLVLPSPDIGFEYHIKIPNIVSVGDRILANIVVEVFGGGFYSNGYTYVSEDLGNTWSKIDFGMRKDIIPANIKQDPGNPEHILLLFRYGTVHEFTSPLSDFLRESYDGGKTWGPLTDIAVGSNGITDVAIVGSTYYLLNPFAGPPIIKLSGSDYEFFESPRIDPFYGMSFGLGSIFFDLDNPKIVYGWTDSIWALGLVKSEDGMKTWKKMDKDIIASTPTIIIAHPTDSNVIMTSGNVIQESYLTRDFGKTWEPFTPVAAGDDVKIDPHNTNHILLVDEMTNIFESYDSGKTFKNINGDFSSAKVFDFEIAKDNPEKIYLSNIGVGISESLDWGEKGYEWHYLTGSSDYAYDIEIDPEDSSIIYATYSPKIFENHSSIWKYDKNYKENFGWKEIFRIENSRGVTSLKFDKANNIYAGVVGKRGRIYYSSDKGKNWQKLNDDFTFVTVHETAIDPNNENIVYAAPWGGGLFRSDDAGDTWTEIETPTISIPAIIVDPVDSNHLIVADRISPKIYESFNQGQDWSELVSLDEDKYYRISTMALHNSELYFSAFNRVTGLISLFLKGPMSGTTFKLEGKNPVEISGDIDGEIIIDFFSHQDKLFAVSHIKGVFIFDGNDWSDVSTNLPDMGFNNIIVDNTDMYVSGASDINLDLNRRIGDDNIVNNIYKSSDNGQSWTPLLNNNPFSSGIKKLLQHSTNKDVFFAATSTGLWVSTDKGTTWTEQNNGLNFKNIGSMAVGNNYIYVGTLGGGMYTGKINSDYSISWYKSTGPYPIIYNILIKTDPTNSNIIYASSYPGGVFKSTDKGKVWIESNFALPSFEVEDPSRQGYYSLEIDPSNPDTLYLGIFGKGVYKSTDGAGVWMPMYGKFGQNRKIMKKGITQIKVDPTNSHNIYLAADDGVYFSDSGAENWKAMNNGLETLDIRSLRITNIVWLPFEDNFGDGKADGWQLEDGWSVTKKNNNYVLQGIGHKWANAGSEGWTDYTFETKIKLIQGSVHINFRKSNEGRYFLGFDDGGLSLSKQFNKWSEFADLTKDQRSYNLNQWYNFRIELDGNNIKVYVDDRLKMDYTDSKPLLNGAIAFETFDDSTVYVDNVNVKIEQIDSIVYAGTGGYGIYRFDPANKKWQNLGRTFGGGWWSPWERRMYQFSSILFDPDVPGKVYYGHFPSGFFISEDNGHTWKDSSLGLGNDGMFSLSMHPYNHDILFAGTYNGVSKSMDGGKTWVIKSNGMPSEQWPYTVAIDSNNPNIMYASTKNGQNKGLCHRNQDTFCGVVMKSTDGGESWFEIMNGLHPLSEFYTIIIYPDNHDILFMGTNSGVYISRDAGNSWKSINNGLPTTNNQVRDNVADNLALTPDNKYLIFGLVSYGAWKADLSKVDLSS